MNEKNKKAIIEEGCVLLFIPFGLLGFAFINFYNKIVYFEAINATMTLQQLLAMNYLVGMFFMVLWAIFASWLTSFLKKKFLKGENKINEKEKEC